MITLSEQQVKCLCHLTKGMTCKEIGSVMGLSPRTVEFYIDIIKRKTGNKKRSSLIGWFLNIHSEINNIIRK
jgi:DNA-binding CsgD family transcriptional regulator